MSVSVYLADLRHNYSGVLANDCMPLSVGYLKAVMDRDLPEARSRLFAYPKTLLDALHRAPPEVLMLSNYMWCEELSFLFGRIAKRINPDMLVVMGGPNIPIEDERRLQYMRAHPEIDLYVLGEADFLATTVVRQFLEADKSLKKLDEQSIASSIHRRRDGELVLNKMWDRHRDVEEIPSPWLSGGMDEFFDGKLAPMIETNRGCPFTCTFCVQGTSWYNKVHYFPKERMKEEIEYIGRLVHEKCPQMGTLRIADSNYGMFLQDIEISSYIGEAQKEYGWPTYIDATTGKNRPERIIESLERVNGALVLYQAVQSLDTETLKQVKRANIKKEAYEQIMVHVRGRGLRSVSDLILGLPGETLKSHIEGIHELINAGTHEMHNFQSMMLKGSEMDMADARAMYEFDTRFRVLPKNFGIYSDEKVFDMDEIVVATDTMPFEDYLKARTYHLASSIFWNDSWFEDVVRYLLLFDIKRADWLDRVVQDMQSDQGAVGELVGEFIEETKNELFPTREACWAFYSQDENFDRLVRGEIGDNLMYKYRALASFFHWPVVCGMALRAARELLDARGASKEIGDFDAFWSDMHGYVESKHAHGQDAETILSPARTEFSYDIARWLEAGPTKDPAAFRLDHAETFEFVLPEEDHREMEAALTVWSTKLVGLSKLVTRIRKEAQVRKCHRLNGKAKSPSGNGVAMRTTDTDVMAEAAE